MLLYSKKSGKKDIYWVSGQVLTIILTANRKKSPHCGVAENRIEK